MQRLPATPHRLPASGYRPTKPTATGFSLPKGGRPVEAPGRGLVGVEGNSPFRIPYPRGPGIEVEVASRYPQGSASVATNRASCRRSELLREKETTHADPMVQKVQASG